MLTTAASIVSLVSGAVTVAAVLVGGGWAYFKFVKGRTFRPRVGVTLAAQWLVVAGEQRLHARVTVRNAGASAITLVQKGTGLRVSVLAPDQPAAPALAQWRELPVFEVFREHDWIEPGETVSDDLLLDLGITAPETVLFEARLGWRYSSRRKEVVVFARQVMPTDATMTS